MADPAMLDARVPDPSFMDDYDTGGEFTPPPQVKVLGQNKKYKFVTFLLQAPEAKDINLKDENGKPLKTREGWLKAVVENVKVVNGGYLVSQTHIGTGQYKKYKDKQPTGEFRNASPAMDYLHAHGIDDRPSSFEQYEYLFKGTADRQFQATLDWQAYDKDAQNTVAEKFEDFPLASTLTGDDLAKFKDWYPDADLEGARVPYIERGGKRFWARAGIKRYISALPGGD